MNILALCTTSTSGSIAIYKENKISFISYLDIRITHSERLLPQIDFGLKQAKLDISEIDLVTIANGPGSFTGIRIGLATAKGICLANKIPLKPVNTLKLLAHNLKETDRDILPMIDAKMREIYAALYSHDHKQIIAPQNAKPKEFLEQIDRPVILLGDATYKYSEIIKNFSLDYKFAFIHQNIPIASALISIALKEPIDDYDFDFISDLEPYYLRKSQAELAKKRKKNEQ